MGPGPQRTRNATQADLDGLVATYESLSQLESPTGDELRQLATSRRRAARSAVIQPDRNQVAIVEAELRARVRLAEQLDLVGRIPALSRLDGLKGEPAVAPRNRDRCQEIPRLAGSRLPIRRDLHGRHVAPARAAFKRPGQAHVESAGHDRET